MVIYLFILLLIYAGNPIKFSFIYDKKIIFLLATFIVYCLIIQLYSVYKNPILQFSVLLIAAPCIIIVVARGLSFIPDKFFTVVAIGLITVFLAQTIYNKKYYSLGIKHGNKSAVKETIEAKNKYGETNVTAIYAVEPFFIKHYMDEFKQNYNCLTSSDSVYNNPVLLSKYLKLLKENYIVLSDPDVFLLEQAKLYFPYLIYHDEGYFKSIFLFSKTNTNSIKDETVLKENNIHHAEGFVFPDNYKKENNNILIDSTDEFPFCVRADFNSLQLKEGQHIVAAASYKPYNVMSDLNVDFSLKKNDAGVFYAGRNLKDSYMPGDTIQHGFAAVFIGTEINAWKDSKLECYIWNKGKKRYTIKDFSMKIIDSNPHKYTLWD